VGASAARDGDRPLVDVAELRRRLGERRGVERTLRFDDELTVGSTTVAAGSGVEVELELESIQGGIAAEGRVRAPWVGECRRCLDPVEGVLQVEVSEVFADQFVEGETYPIANEAIDLRDLARDAVLLDLPPAPLCRPDCPGPEPERFTVTVESDDEPGPLPRDPRWAALDVLREDQPDE
jgi:uncharacterized protein